MNKNLSRVLLFLSVFLFTYAFGDTPPQIINVTCSAHNWLSKLAPGNVSTCSQPAYSDISGSLPFPSGSTLGGIESISCAGGNFLNAIGTNGVPVCSPVPNPTLYYQTVQSNATSQNQRSNLNFTTNFTLSDSAGSNRTTVDLASTISSSINGNAATATALASIPSGCATNTFAKSIAANGDLSCIAVPNAATTATNSNTPSTIVQRDGSGNFSAGVISASLSGNASTASALASVPSGCASNTFASSIAANGNLGCASIPNAATTASSSNSPSTIVQRDSSGNFSAGTISAAITGHSSLDLPLTGGALSGALTLPAGLVATPSLLFTGAGSDTGFYSEGIGTIDVSLTGQRIMNLAADVMAINGVTDGDLGSNAGGTIILTGGQKTDAVVSAIPASVYVGGARSTNGGPLYQSGGDYADATITSYGATNQVIGGSASFGGYLYAAGGDYTTGPFNYGAYYTLRGGNPTTGGDIGFAGGNVEVANAKAGSITFAAGLGINATGGDGGNIFFAPGSADDTGGGVPGQVVIQPVINNSSSYSSNLVFKNPGGFNTGFKGSDTAAANAVWTLPAVDGSANQVLVTNGSKALSFANPLAASYLPLSTGSLTSISANQIVGAGKTARAQTIENITGVATAFTCTGNPVLSLLDCGTSAGVCTSGTTTLGSVTITAVNTVTAGSVSTAAIAAGHFWAWKITSGTCTVFNATGTAEAAMQ